MSLISLFEEDEDARLRTPFLEHLQSHYICLLQSFLYVLVYQG